MANNNANKRSIRRTGDDVAALSNVLNKSVDVSIVATKSQESPKKGIRFQNTSTPIRSSRLMRIPKTPKKIINKAHGVDNSHLLSVRELRSLFSPAKKQETNVNEKLQNKIKVKPTVHKIVITKPKIIFKSPRKTKANSNNMKTEIVKDKENVSVSKSVENAHNESIILLKETPQKPRVPFYYLGKCSREANY